MQHDEYSSTAAVRVIVPLSCSLRGQELPIEIVKESLAGALYQRTQVAERYYCAYGINPDYRSHFTSDLLTVAGFDSAGEIRVLEIEDHPFFLATLYVPQALSSGSCPHPLVTGFLKSALQNRYASGI
jgi:CTP synthase (UTP-ammonia lyase)